MHDERLKLLYIASSGLSGSTILDLLLGAHGAFWTLGEFYVLPWELRENRKPCGCGSPVGECDFWQPVLAESEAVLAGGQIERFRTGYLKYPVVVPGETGFLLSNTQRRMRRRRAALRCFAEANEHVLRAVLRQARSMKGDQVQWLVDASKSIYRLLWLQASDRFDVRVIHLYKDPRAFVFSLSKEKHGFRRPLQLVRATFRWNVENYLFDRLFQAHFDPSCVLRLRYDDLAGQPEATLRQIADWTGVVHDANLSERFREVNHAIAGNPARFETRDIRVDERWKTHLSRLTQASIRWFSAPVVRRLQGQDA